MHDLWIPLHKPEYSLRSWVNNNAESLALSEGLSFKKENKS